MTRNPQPTAAPEGRRTRRIGDGGTSPRRAFVLQQRSAGEAAWLDVSMGSKWARTYAGPQATQFTLAFIGLLLLGVAIFTIVSWPADGSYTLLLTLGLCAAIGGGLFYGIALLGRDRRRLASLLDQWGERPFKDVVAEVLGQMRTRYEQWLVQLLSSLANAGHSGFTIRQRAPDTPPHLEPLTVPFEPLPIDCRDARFRQIAGAVSAEPPGPIRLWWKDLRADDYFSLRIGVAALLLATVTLVSVRRGFGADSAAQTLAAIIFLRPKSQFDRSGRSYWMLVPGGLIIRSRGVSRLCTRQNANLVLFGNSRGVASATVTIAGYIASRFLDALEAETLLRAWLSPLPPPTAEQVRDWAER